MNHADFVMKEISRILSKYGEAPAEAEKNETALPKLLHCLIEMEQVIERLKEEQSLVCGRLSEVITCVGDSLAEKVKVFLFDSVTELTRTDIDTKDKKW